MEELREKYKALQEELENDYKEAVVKLCEKYGCDLGVGYDRLEAIARGNKEYGEGLDLNLEGFKDKYIEKLYVSEQIAKASGNL